MHSSSLCPDDVFDIGLCAGAVRSRTSDVLAVARGAEDGQLVFTGRLTSIYVSAQDRRQSVTVPDQVRHAYAAYRERHPVPEALSRSVAR